MHFLKVYNGRTTASEIRFLNQLETYYKLNFVWSGAKVFSGCTLRRKQRMLTNFLHSLQPFWRYSAPYTAGPLTDRETGKSQIPLRYPGRRPGRRPASSC